MTRTPGILCFSVDSQNADPLSIEPVRRGKELAEITQRFGIPGNWTFDENTDSIPDAAEPTATVPKGLSRRELIQHLRQMTARALRDGKTLRSVVMDPHEARAYGDLLVRQGCTITRPRSANSTSDTNPRILRGGLWIVPLTCQFVGGSRRSVRSLLGVCKRRLVDAAKHGGLFHVNVEIGARRDSWTEEREAISSLFELANEFRQHGMLQCAQLGELPAILTRKSSQPMLSILKRAV